MLAESFSEVHELPGRDLMPVLDGAQADDARAVYLMTRDNMLEGDSGASGLARRLKRTVNPPAPLRIRIPAHVGSNFEGLAWCDVDGAAPVEAGPYFRRSGYVDRAGAAALGGQRSWWRGVPDVTP